MKTEANPRIYRIPFAAVYPLYIAKVERKGRSAEEVNQVITWLTGYTLQGMQEQIQKQTSLEDFYAQAPEMNPKRRLVTGVICGVRVEDIKESTMQNLRYLDKLIDELAKGKTMEKILRASL